MSFIPGATLDPGIHWNYEAGYMRYIEAIVWHYTVGVDSRAIGRRGYFAILIRQDGEVVMFAPWDSINWHACEWNPITIGIEVESLDGSITDLQIVSLGIVSYFLMVMTGITATFWDGGRIPVGSSIPAGVTNHRDLHENACDEHYDGFDLDVFVAAMNAANPPPVPVPVPIPPPPPPPPPDPNEGDDEMGLKLMKWKDDVGEHQDLIGTADDGSVFTTSGFDNKPYFIAGPRATPDVVRSRYAGKIKLGQVPVVIVNEKEIRFRVQAEEDGGTKTIECYWRRSDDAGADGSRWGSYPADR